ncbi:amino acid kinase family protein [Schlesneria paludicola]|uniref:amino acid kinase family protein n=1 Tax=Schlesneria paludicola TaxID=360056 RepID=UPI00029AB27D|nr:aspartokinase uridylate kinase [Schlesneria paludicola]
MTVVFKLGGSVLTHPTLADTIRTLVRYRENERCLFVVGGGAAADVVRDWSRIHQLSEEQSHWLAIASLELNMQLIRTLLKWQSVATREQAEICWSRDPSPLLVEMPAFACEQESSGRTIPHDWNVTSDSLAAWVAECWPADELVLVKSVPTPRQRSIQEASQLGLVDAYFPQIAQRLRRISWCDLRASQIELEDWQS